VIEKIGHRWNQDKPDQRRVEILALWKYICGVLQNMNPIKKDTLDSLQTKLDRFGALWLEVVQHKDELKVGNKTLSVYVHIIVCHLVDFLKKYGSVAIFSQQGAELMHSLEKSAIANQTPIGTARPQKTFHSTRNGQLRLLVKKYPNKVALRQFRKNAIEYYVKYIQSTSSMERSISATAIQPPTQSSPTTSSNQLPSFQLAPPEDLWLLCPEDFSSLVGSGKGFRFISCHALEVVLKSFSKTRAPDFKSCTVSTAFGSAILYIWGPSDSSNWKDQALMYGNWKRNKPETDLEMKESLKRWWAEAISLKCEWLLIPLRMKDGICAIAILELRSWRMFYFDGAFGSSIRFGVWNTALRRAFEYLLPTLPAASTILSNFSPDFISQFSTAKEVDSNNRTSSNLQFIDVPLIELPANANQLCSLQTAYFAYCMLIKSSLTAFRETLADSNYYEPSFLRTTWQSWLAVTFSKFRSQHYGIETRDVEIETIMDLDLSQLPTQTNSDRTTTSQTQKRKQPKKATPKRTNQTKTTTTATATTTTTTTTITTTPYVEAFETQQKKRRREQYEVESDSEESETKQIRSKPAKKTKNSDDESYSE
jgi:hypothetical protein